MDAPLQSGPTEPQALTAPAPRSDENPVWSGWDIVLIIVFGLLGILASGALVGTIAGAAGVFRRIPAESLNRDIRFILPVQLISYAVVLGAMYQLVAGRYRTSFLRAIRWNWPATRFWSFLLIGIALGTLVQGVEHVLPMPRNLPIEDYFRDAVSAYLIGIFGIFIAPLVEELFFRGFLYPVAARRFGIVGGVLLTSALFALIHAAQLGYHLAPLAVMMVVGLSLSVVRAWTKSVASSVLVHVGYNTCLFVLLWIATDRFRHLERLAN